MAAASTQPEVQIPQHPVSPVSPAHRWTDLGLVLMVAFATSIAGSIFRAFHPRPINDSTVRLTIGMLDELWPLVLLFVLLKRQGRGLRDLGLSFHWKDLWTAARLTISGFIAYTCAFRIINQLCLLLTYHPYNDPVPRSPLGASLVVTLLFDVVNGFHEEVIVRGYLMTELMEFGKTPLFAAVVSLAIQTSYHLYYGVLGAIIVGCGLSMFALYFGGRRRLMPVILAHIFWDVTVAFLRFHHS